MLGSFFSYIRLHTTLVYNQAHEIHTKSLYAKTLIYA